MYDYVENGTESELWHIGTATSGRYPRGSGERPYQHVGGKRHGSAEDMSDDELKNAISRRTKENQYNKLFPDEATARKKDKQDKMQEAIRDKQLQDTYDRLFPDEETKARKDLVETADKVGKSLSELGNKIPNSTAKPDYSKDLSNMTDNDLRNTINRLNMEKQYRTLMAEKELGTSKKEQGKAKVKEFLSIAGPVVSTAGSAVGIGLAIYSAMHKK